MAKKKSAKKKAPAKKAAKAKKAKKAPSFKSSIQAALRSAKKARKDGLVAKRVVKKAAVDTRRVGKKSKALRPTLRKVSRFKTPQRRSGQSSH